MKVAVPAVVGVPVMAPDVSVRPLGSVPAVTAKVYGPVPPVADSAVS